MSVLKSQFNYKLDQCSPADAIDLEVQVKKAKDGAETVVFVPIDYEKIIKANGVVTDWSLSSLIAAGIDPGFAIHTTPNSRVEGLGEIEAIIDSLPDDLFETTDTVEKDTTVE